MVIGDIIRYGQIAIDSVWGRLRLRMTMVNDGWPRSDEDYAYLFRVAMDIRGTPNEVKYD